MQYIKIPDSLTRESFAEEFGYSGLYHYEERIRERMAAGKIYYDPLKTAYIWAYQDRQTGHGYFSTLFISGMNSRKQKNHGRS